VACEGCNRFVYNAKRSHSFGSRHAHYKRCPSCLDQRRWNKHLRFMNKTCFQLIDENLALSKTYCANETVVRNRQVWLLAVVFERISAVDADGATWESRNLKCEKSDSIARDSKEDRSNRTRGNLSDGTKHFRALKCVVEWFRFQDWNGHEKLGDFRLPWAIRIPSLRPTIPCITQRF
jgi:hypothetical protein